MPALSFEHAWSAASGIPGWLTREQALVLHREATRVAPGTVVEIGSHLGRSTVVLAASGSRIVAIDPFPPHWRYGGSDTRDRFHRNLRRSGVDQDVELRATTSARARARWSGPVSLVYVDGKHDFWTCRDDLRWRRTLPPGGRFLVHDAFSSLGVTAALLHLMVTDRSVRLVSRTGSLAVYESGVQTRARDRARVLRQLPWFARNVVVKILLRLRLRRLARAIGHVGDADPY